MSDFVSSAGSRRSSAGRLPAQVTSFVGRRGEIARIRQLVFETRLLRLMRVHEDLLAADQRHHTVARIAHRHGFSHLGRFAAAYRAAYGCNPSATQRLSGAVQQPAAAHGRPTAHGRRRRRASGDSCAQRVHRS